MFVANHISWSDIHALNSVIPVRFIAKSDIKSWPIFGYLVRKSNTIFVERGKRQEAGRIVDLTKESLSAGDNVCFFPEGTTTDGTGADGKGIKSNRLQGRPDAAPAEPPKAAYDRPKVLVLKQQLLELNALAPHPRGYAFEAWLRDAFNLHRLEAREPFRNRGEQIDGSFVLHAETYLLEAKWEGDKTPAKDLHAFQGCRRHAVGYGIGELNGVDGALLDGVFQILLNDGSVRYLDGHWPDRIGLARRTQVRVPSVADLRLRSGAACKRPARLADLQREA